MSLFIFTVCAYLIGSIPFGLLFTHWAGAGDVRTIGSGNIGATNVLRTGNKKIAALTLLCDALKGAIPILLIQHYAHTYNFPSHFIVIVAATVVLGHVFPIWLKFKGGKGVATALGVYIAINPLFALSIIAIWGIVTKLFKISSLSALIACIAAPAITYIWHGPTHLCIISCMFAILILFTHRDNIKRLCAGNEHRV